MEKTNFWRVKVGATFSMNGEYYFKESNKTARTVQSHKQIEVREETEVSIVKNLKEI